MFISHNIFFTCRANQHKDISFSDVCIINNVEMLHIPQLYSDSESILNGTINAN